MPERLELISVMVAVLAGSALLAVIVMTVKERMHR